jgi:hypothetical protein
MRAVFGEVNLDEEKIIKFTLIVFATSYILRVICETLIYAYEEPVETAYWQKPDLYTGLVLCTWALWDFLPLISMLIIHFRSFKSFEAASEVLLTEYSVDDVARGTF